MSVLGLSACASQSAPSGVIPAVSPTRSASPHVSQSVPATSVSGLASRVIVPSQARVPAGTIVTLSGQGFPAGQRIQIWECAFPTAVAPGIGCATGSRTTLRTRSDGTFHVRFLITLCPARAGTGSGTRTCYVGVPVPEGVDVLRLTGQTAIVVSQP